MPPAKQKHVVIATPAYDGKLEHSYVSSLLATVEICREYNIKLSWHVLPRNALLAMARNLLIRNFLQIPGATDLFFIDADQGWSAKGFLRVLQAKPDVVAGICHTKEDPPQWPVQLWKDPNGNPVQDRDGLYRIVYAPTGFLRISRSVFTRMIEANPERVIPKGDGPVPCLFDCERQGASWQGEDVVFSRRWAEIGGECWAIPGLPFLHTGTKTWSGTWSPQLPGPG